MALFRIGQDLGIYTASGFPACPCFLLITKLFIQGVASCTGTSTSACNILFISCWNSAFQMYRDWSARCLFGWHAWIQLDVIIWSRELTNPLKDIWVLLHNHFFACYKLGSLFSDCWCLGLDSSCMYSFGQPPVSSGYVGPLSVFFGWSAELVIKLALGGR